MQVPAAAPLFAWQHLEDSPSLRTLADLLGTLPDEELLAALRQHRGRGRNEYPVEVLWGVLLLTVALRHTEIERCLEELRRNPSLRLLIGCETESDVPKKWNVSRFLKTLGRVEFLELMQTAFQALARELASVVPDFARDIAGDATCLNARRDRAEADGLLPPPTGGRKEYRDEQGNVTEVVEWFGYKLHLLVDAKHEVAFAYEVTDTKAGDGETLPVLLEQAEKVLPARRAQTLAYDRAADTNEVHHVLHHHGIRPVIQTRKLWNGDAYRDLPGARRHPVPIRYDERGAVYCFDPSEGAPVRRPMAFCGHERNRGTVKYRCPALLHNLSCGSERRCNKGKTYGLTIRLKCEHDLRRFPPLPRQTLSFERLYKGRTSVERVNGRLKLYWGADDGNVTGAARFHARVGVVMLVHIAFARLLATAERKPDRLGYVGLGPVQEALRRA